LKYYYHVGYGSQLADLDPLPSDAEIQDAITAQVNAVKDSSAIAVWCLQPEELVSTNANHMHYLQVATAAIRAADAAAQRPIWCYESNGRTDNQLAVTVPYLDLCGKGMYTNFAGNQDNRIYCQWSIQQETAAIAAANPSAVPLAVPEMFQDPAAQDAYLIGDWTRHDVYASLINGAKGVVVFSGFRRAELANYFDDYYQGYAAVAKELTGPLNLGQVFLFGEHRSDIAVSITSGPTTVSMTTPESYTASSVNYADLADAAGARYLFVVNSANNSVGVTISGLPTGTVYRKDLFESAMYDTMTGGSFAVTLDPLQVKAWQFVQNTGDVSGPAQTPDGTVNLYDFARLAEAWLLCTEPNPADCL
jgi:hypothetical protein